MWMVGEGLDQPHPTMATLAPTSRYCVAVFVRKLHEGSLEGGTIIVPEVIIQ
jgi:hypothetical protein